MRDIQPVLLSGVSKGGNAPIWHTTLLAKCSVLYALSALLRKCRCRWEWQAHLKRQENRAVIMWRGAASAGLVSSADRAYMKALVPRPTLRLVDKVSRSCGHTPGKVAGQRATPQSAWPHFLSFWSILFLKIEMSGKPFCGFAISPINWELLCKTLYFSIFYYEQCCKYNFKNKHH